MTKEWVLRRAFSFGRAGYRREFRDQPTSPKLLLGIPRYLIREIVAQASRYGRAKLGQDADSTFTERWRFQYLVGRAVEGRSLHSAQ